MLFAHVQAHFLLLVMSAIVISSQRMILTSQRIVPAWVTIFLDMMTCMNISWLNKENMNHDDIMLKIDKVLIAVFFLVVLGAVSDQIYTELINNKKLSVNLTY